MLHNLHHSPPLKNKTMNIILIPKLLHIINNELIITSMFPFKNLSVNDKMSKQPIVFGAMNQMGMIMSKL